MKKKVLITVGGTGGHVYPAMALAEQLVRDEPGIELLFVGGGLSRNRYFERDAFTYKDVSCATLSLGNPWTALRHTGSILKGILQSNRIIKGFNPDVVVGFGSYHTLPILLAAKWRSIPIVLHEANRIPGRVNRLLSKHVELTGVHFADTAYHLKGKAKEIAIPLRSGYTKGALSKEQARAHFQLDPKRPTLLIFGGSQGAQAINRLVSEAIVQLAESQLQVLHFTGDVVAAQDIQKLYANAGVKATVKAFESRMDIAWQAANLIISRAGAGTIAEELEFEVPGILIPYPYATDNHQESNADFMVGIVRGAIKFTESGFEPETLAQEILTLFEDDEQGLEEMKQAMRLYKQRTKSLNLCGVIRDMIKQDK